jgi:hypothetical protein
MSETQIVGDPEPSELALTMAQLVLLEFPAITHGISIPSSINETITAENAYLLRKVAQRLQARSAKIQVDKQLRQ